MDFRKTEFIKSASRISDCPADTGMEIAFAGRSNAGKSSALNRITGRKSLARVSKTPGRTQLLNFFAVADGYRFVDLPGYGYAKVPEAVKRDWGKMVDGYLRDRKSLAVMILVMDCRHPLTDFDMQLIQWCEASELPVHCLLTKADKLSNGKAKSQQLAVARELAGLDVDCSVSLFSSLKGTGLDEMRNRLQNYYKIARDQADYDQADPDQAGE